MRLPRLLPALERCAEENLQTVAIRAREEPAALVQQISWQTSGDKPVGRHRNEPWMRSKERVHDVLVLFRLA